MMSRLIDAGALKKELMHGCLFGKEWDRQLALCAVDSQPTVDLGTPIKAYFRDQIDAGQPLDPVDTCADILRIVYAQSTHLSGDA